jgi:hypothetical protein
MLIESTLTSSRIQLRLLSGSDADALVQAASDGELWNLTFTVVPSAATVDDYVRVAMEGHEAGTVIPFVTVLRETGQIIGSTRFFGRSIARIESSRSEAHGFRSRGRKRSSTQRRSTSCFKWPLMKWSASEFNSPLTKQIQSLAQLSCDSAQKKRASFVTSG